jgi:hypothetical protein
MTMLTPKQVALLRRFAVQEAAATQRGRRWLALLRAHWREFLWRYAASPVLRQRTSQALSQAAALIESRNTDRPRVIDNDTIATAEAVLAELDTRRRSPAPGHTGGPTGAAGRSR